MSQKNYLHKLPLRNAPHDDFAQLITNPESYKDIFETGESSIKIPFNEDSSYILVDTGSPIGDAYEYLHSVSTGKNGRPYCPFVGSIEKNNSYYIKEYDLCPTPMSVQETVIEMVDILVHISGHAVPLNKTDLTSIVGVFSHEYAQTAEAFSLMSGVHETLRPEIIKRGMMLACVHRLHEIGGRPESKHPDEPMFVSKIPLLILRRINKYDSVFMKTDADKKVFSSFFGSI